MNKGRHVSDPLEMGALGGSGEGNREGAAKEKEQMVLRRQPPGPPWRPRGEMLSTFQMPPGGSGEATRLKGWWKVIGDFIESSLYRVETQQLGDGGFWRDWSFEKRRSGYRPLKNFVVETIEVQEKV